MKNKCTKLVLLLLLTFTFQLSTVFSQVPQAINFQAIARDGFGNPMINTNIQIRLSVIDSTLGGSIVYQELRALQTNAYGSFSFQIGVAPAFTTIGTFQGINWVTGGKHLKIDYDPTNTFTFTLTLGTIKFVTVPYAFAAEKVVFIDATGAQNGDALVFNSVAGKFEPSQISGSNYIAGSGISIVGNIISNTGDLSSTNELQTLSISNDTLYLTNGGFVKLPSASSSVLLPPTAITQAASNLQSYTATLNGTVNANGLSTNVVFEWGLTTAYGSNATATQSPVTGTSVVAVSANLMGLQSNTTYHYRIKATNAVNVTYSSDMSFATAASAPQLTTTAISAILAFTATSGGNVTYDGGATVTTRGICYSTSPTPTTANSTIPSGTGSGSFVSNLTGLTYATTYYVRSYATNSVGTSYGNELSFTTQNGVVTLTTTSITAITALTATTGGNITADGGSTITARGVCWNTNSAPTLANSFTNNGAGTGLFTSNITGLALGTTYYVRAYATNSVGTTYGNELSFTTIALPTVTTSAFSDVKGNSASAGGSITNNGGGTITAQGLCWSTSTNPTTANSFNTSFTAVMTVLSPNTVYYVRAYATNLAGTGYGNQISFNSGKVIGSTFGGGLVFYNDGAAHGLVCAPTDQSTGAYWGCQGTVIGGTLTALNTGFANTNAIVAGCTTPGIAAKLCDTLTLGGYTDWYLPAKDELNLMYVNLHTQSLGGFASNYYWSSSEYDASNAWRQNFSSGNQNSPSKDGSNLSVRAARAF